MQGTEKVNDKDIVFSTWQSIFKLNEKWFSSFDVVIVDECFDEATKVLTPLRMDSYITTR